MSKINIEKLIRATLRKRGEARVAEIVKKTGLSRVYVHRFFKKLVQDKVIVRIGKANQTHYVSAGRAQKMAQRKKTSLRRVYLNENLSEDRVLHAIKTELLFFDRMPHNVGAIFDYAFTEMMNNAIEHSRSRHIEVRLRATSLLLTFDVIDRGIGIFANLMRQRKLKSELEAIEDLTKGKQTTAPLAHSGEGIFFTSKVGDQLIIQSGGKKLIFDVLVNDIFVSDIAYRKGTKVTFVITKNSKRNLNLIFRAYIDGSFDFGRTSVLVRLYKLDRAHISRSQARRVVSGLEKFKTVMLDFDGVETVGQAFADEVFRVWQSNHKNTKIKHSNANKNIEFMIQRALRTTSTEL